MSEPILVTRALTKKYGGAAAVEGVDLYIEKGQIYGLLGRNGAGKTTIIRMLTAQTVPTSGEIELFGETGEKGISAARARVGAMVEIPSFYPYLTARENLRIYTTLLGLPEKNIDEALKIVRLDRPDGKRLSAYSLGMKQRFGIASAMLGFPKLLILDEPTNGLDPSGIQEMRELIRSLPERCGMTVIISSHILSEIDRIVDDIGIIANGELRYQGELERLHEIDEGKTLEEIFLDMTGKDLSL